MRKIVFIFPGIGYHVDKPLLYYGRRLAQNFGFDEVINVSYGGFRQGIRGNQEKMREAFESALQQAEACIRTEAEKLDPQGLPGLLEAGAETLVISKSIGTAVAAAFQRKYKIAAKNIYFTPVRQSFLFIRPESGIVFHGTSDPWAETADIREGCEKAGLPLYITEGVNHSMESGDAIKDLEILQSILQRCRSYLEKTALS